MSSMSRTVAMPALRRRAPRGPRRPAEAVSAEAKAADAPQRSTARLRQLLLVVAAALVVGAIFLPLWGMTLASVQYPEGLRMIVYPTRLTGDIREINMLNHYIGMIQISEDFFAELKLLPVFFAVIALAAFGAAFVRRIWATALPLVLMAGVAVYGFWSMNRRLHQFGHDLDPMAAMKIEPFTPPMIGENQIAQFGTYSYFSWGTALPIIAGLLVTAALWLDVHARRTGEL